jgi:signal transduction histidine kinase
VNPRKSESEIAELKSCNQMLQAQLLHAQKQSALGELVGTTTHEFNNVLMTILNYAKMGLRHQDVETRNKAFEKILAAGQRASKMTNSILAMARNRSDQLEPTDLRRIIDDTLFLLERELQKYRISVELDLPEVPLAMANGNQIQQVVMNLLINARQAMAGGGRIVIRLAHDAASQTVDLSIRDYGPGIPEARLPKLFQPYYTTKSGPDETGKGGTGLGLFACRQIIEAHRGRVRVESSVGQGTCFTIKLPMASAIVPPPVVALPKSISQSPMPRI